MGIERTIESHARQPLTHQVLLSFLQRYRQPNAKLHALQKEGILESVKKGLYIAGPALNAGRPEPFLLANHVLGPSYVSLETALAYYEMIPERVYETASMTTKASRRFEGSSMGVFSFTRLALPYYAFGIRRVELGDEQFALVASPEKALCDTVITTSGLLFRSPGSAGEHLIENLRMDEAVLKTLDTAMIRSWLDDAPKRESLSMMIKMIDSL